MRFSAGRTGILIGLFTMISGPTAKAGGDDNLLAVLATLRSHAEAYPSFDVAWSGTQRAVPQFLSDNSAEQLKVAGIDPGKLVEFPIEGRFARDEKGRVRVEYMSTCLALRSKALKRKRAIEIFDGAKATVFFSEGEAEYPFASITSDGARPIARKAMLLPIRLIVSPFDQDLGVLPADPAKLALNRESVNGVPCVRISSKDYIVWLSERDDYLPVKLHHVDQGRTIIALECETEPAKSAKFPLRSWVQRSIDSKGGIESETKAVVTTAQTGLNLSDDFFRIDFPEGTWVSDQTKNEKYLVKPGGHHRPIRPGEFTGTNYQELLTTDPPAAPSRTKFIIGIAVSVLTIAVIVAVFFVRRRRVSHAQAP